MSSVRILGSGAVSYLLNGILGVLILSRPDPIEIFSASGCSTLEFKNSSWLKMVFETTIQKAKIPA